jgi:Helicase HerA, central domain
MNNEKWVSLSIIESIGGGLRALVSSNITKKTLNVVACLEATWEILCTKALKADTDGFKGPQMLRPINKQQIAEEIVSQRLSEAFQRLGFVPPYSSWPFKPESFDSAITLFPREILKKSEEHRQKCLRESHVTELSEFGSLPKHTDLQSPDGLAWLDQVYEDLRREAPLQQLLAEDSEDETLGKLLQSACRCRIKESPFGEEVDAVVDAEFPGGKSYRSLHARLRLIYRKEGDREKHYCFRALQRSNAIAYQNRLKAAMTAAGIDRNLEFRHLIIVRSTPIPGGSATQSLTNKFRDAGGLSVSPSEQDLRSLWALAKMEEQHDPGFEDWLKARRPVCKLELMQVAKLGKDEKASDNGAEPKKDASEQEPALHHGLPWGKRLIGDQPQEALYVSLAMLVKHTVVLAGSGSGKTVLVRRLTEEAALMGIPSIVIDTANDLARLGDPWPQHPALWNSEDEAKAKTYHDGIEVVVWTPGREKGNPLNLEPLPDLAAVADNTDELEQAVDMARESLQPIVAAGASSGAQKKQGVLTAALKYFAKHQGARLRNFINLLSDLPPEAGGGISNSVKLAQEMADLLRAEVQKNVLLRQSGTALDPAVLFGDGTANRPRISVINFTGLPSFESQQQFLNQLAMTLFTWIKKHPAPPERPLRGLLIIDEAKDLVPSGKSVPCKASILRLAAQARKYGLGLIFATQAPKSIDHNIIANCSTHYYGKASSPAAIDAIREQLKSRGGSGHDIATLKTGCFYVYTEGLQAPIKVSIPLCLSHHPASPLDETEVLKRAVRSHGLLFGLDRYQRFG